MKLIMATSAGISRQSASHSSFPSRCADDYSCDRLSRSVLWMTLLDAERLPGPPDFPTTEACRNMCSHSAPSFPVIVTDRASNSWESLPLFFGATATDHAAVEACEVSFCTDGVQSPLRVWARI